MEIVERNMSNAGGGSRRNNRTSGFLRSGPLFGAGGRGRRQTGSYAHYSFRSSDSQQRRFIAMKRHQCWGLRSLKLPNRPISDDVISSKIPAALRVAFWYIGKAT